MKDWSPHAIQQTPLISDEDVWWMIRFSRNYSYGLPVILLITPIDSLPQKGECLWPDEWRKKLH